MSDLNSWSCTGRLTRDAELKNINDKKLLVFYIAVNFGSGDKQETLYAKILKWGNNCESVFPYLVKGKMVSVTGPIKLDTYTTKNNDTYTDLIMTADRINLINTGYKQTSSAEPENEGVEF